MSKILRTSLLLLVLFVFYLPGQVHAAALSGSYTIDGSLPASATNFRDFTSAITFLTGSGARSDGGPSNTAPFGVSGAVRFQVAAGTYTGQVVLDGRLVPGISAVNTLTFDGGTAAPQVVANVAGPVILLRQSSYVTLRGLVVINNDRTSPAGIMIHGNASAANNGTGCKVKQCTITLFNKTHIQSVGISLTDSNATMNWSKTWADSVEIDSNQVTGGYMGIYVSGAASTLYNRHIRVSHNKVSNIKYGAVIYAVCNGLDFLYNDIANTGLESPVNTTEDMVRFYQCNNAGPYPHRIIGNRLDADLGALAFEYGTGVSTVPVQMYNNMIRARLSGIKLMQAQNSPNYYQVYHNTVYVLCRVASQHYGGVPFTYISQGQQGGLKCRNNIFAVDGATTPVLSVAAFVGDTASELNNNVYYNPNGAGGRIITRRDSIYYTSLTNVLVPALGGDSSVIARPHFVSDNNLLLANACQWKGADLRAEVPDDINGSPRASAPLAGCHEFSSQSLDLGVEALLSPVLPASAGSYDLTLLVRNTGTATVGSFTAAYTYKGNTYTRYWAGLLSPCDTVSVTFGIPDQVTIDSSALELKVYVSDPNGAADMNPANDTLFIRELKGTYTIGAAQADYRSFAEAIEALYEYGMAGSVTFSVQPGTYAEQIRLIGSNIRGLSFDNRLVFRGSHGADSSIITGNFQREATVIIQNACYVTFEGLTIENLNTTAGAGVGIAGNVLAQQYNGSQCRVRNCRISTPGTSSVGINVTGNINGFDQGSISADSVQLDSNLISAGLHGIIFQGMYNASSCWGNVIRYNTVLNFSGNAISLAGVHNGFDIMGNTISGNVSCQAGINILGFSNPGTSTMRIHGNRISAPAVNGMNIIGCWALSPSMPFEIYNNSVVNAATGIYYNTSPATQTPPAAYIDVLHNSVNVNVTRGGTGYAFLFANANTPGGGRIQNNIFAVTAPSGTSVPLYCQTPLGTVGSIDYNNYYNTTGPGLVYRGTMYNMSNFNTAASGGDSSLNRVAPWVSATDLRLTAGCRLNGINLAPVIVSDIDGHPRNASPNLGCYEHQPLSFDLAIESIIAPAYPVVSGIQDVKIRLVNNGMSTITSATVVCELNGTPVSQGWSGSLARCDEAVLVFSNMLIADSNGVKVYLSSVNGVSDNLQDNDTVKATLRSCLSGTYSIGAAPSDYPDFTAAITDMLARGVAGPVVFEVKSGVYTEQFELTGYVQGMSHSNTVTFRSAASHPDSVILRFASGLSGNYIVRFNNALHFTLKNISLVALDSSYSRVVEFAGASSYNTIDSCRIISTYYSPAGLLSQDRIAIYAPSLSGHHNVITNNLIRDSHIGIRLYGVSQSDLSEGNLIENNRIENIRYYHIEPKFTRNLRINGNQLITGSTSGVRAIYATYCDDSMEVCRNTIRLYGNGYGMFMVFNDGSLFARGLISNNDIYIGGAASGSTYGIYTGSGSYQLYYNNSVHIAAGGTGSYAGYFQFTNALYNSNEVKNNIFANSSTGCALFFHALPVTCESDYNLLYSAGASVFERLAAYPNPTKVASLEAWRRFTGKDMHSLVYRPAFTGAENLVPNPADSAVWAINGRGIHLDSMWIRTDKNGVQKPLTPGQGVPDVGAYECTPASVPPACEAVPPVMPLSLPADSMQVFLFGQDTAATITWTASHPVAATTILRQYTGEMPPGIGKAGERMFVYNTVSMSTRGVPTYDLRVTARKEWLGTIGLLADVRAISEGAPGVWTLDQTSRYDSAFEQLERTGVQDSSYLVTGTSVNDPLPVTLLDLRAAWVKQAVQVNWSTASERNTSSMEVQRSYDGRSFVTVSTLAAAGNSNTLRRYHIMDHGAEQSAAREFYYRIRITDKDGSSSFSHVVKVRHNESHAPEILVYPNPAEDRVYVSAAVQAATPVRFTVTDLAGQELLTLESEFVQAGEVPVILTGQLSRGIYLLRVEYDDVKQVLKLVKR